MPLHATLEYTFSMTASFLVLNHTRERDRRQPFMGLPATLLTLGILLPIYSSARRSSDANSF